MKMLKGEEEQEADEEDERVQVASTTGASGSYPQAMTSGGRKSRREKERNTKAEMGGL